MRTCGLPREQLFVTGKVAAEHKDYDSAARSIDETLRKKRLDYLDMMIIHSPQPWADFCGGDDMERLKQAAPIKDYGEFSHFPVFSGK